MSWIFLAVAVVFEVAVAVSAGLARGFTRLWWTAATLVCGAVATFFLSLALLTFDVGVGYALWTSLSGVILVVVGTLFLDQPLTASELLGMAVVLTGVVGLNLTGAA
ncbi:multidrug efflux SMR transporter [Ornithinimicrobium humiphilum]|uniref:Quaternary ammonium compound-resistance protein SugE n=1 Tax=Ornithinimicrobium humiphilum TaxID=125288 RepID=A0A543KK28_9MICO|nr:SMR family transporter [Ornithinimicrobium humiphilum]TQM95432.1 quaternary ammonium compound-resistance protein SugE [Ornithinimicrobium humiphilum]